MVQIGWQEFHVYRGPIQSGCMYVLCADVRSMILGTVCH